MASVRILLSLGAVACLRVAREGVPPRALRFSASRSTPTPTSPLPRRFSADRQVCRMAFRFSVPATPSLHETLTARAGHDILVRGPVRTLIDVCPEFQALCTRSGESWIAPYWLVASLALTVLGPEPDVPAEDWDLPLWAFFADAEDLGRPFAAILESGLFVHLSLEN